MRAAFPCDAKLTINCNLTIKKFFDEPTKQKIINPKRVIGRKAFAGDSNLRKIVLPGTIKKISKDAFKGIADDAVFYIKGTEDDLKRIKKLLKKSGLDVKKYGFVLVEEK